MILTAPQFGDLQRTIALRTPVLVCGPGCHRIGYDQSSGWREAQRRMSLVWDELAWLWQHDEPLFPAPEGPRTFLEQLWVSKLSDETFARHESVFRLGELPAEHSIRPAEDGGDPPSGDPEDRPGLASQGRLDRFRTILSSLVLATLYESTRCLGNVIATGSSPVTSWQDVGHPGVYGGVSTNADADEADAARRRATMFAEDAVALAEYLHLLNGRFPDADPAVAERYAMQHGTISKEIGRMLRLWKIGAVHSTTKHVLEHCFQRRDLPLTGAMIEWLSDLFWHLVVTDTTVPPSQADLTFYVNLYESKTYGARTFGRSRPGEGRGGIAASTLPDDVRSLLSTYDSGAEVWSDIAPQRLAVAETMMASLLVMWRKGNRRHDPLPLALISDYDLTFERALMELLEPGQKFHVVVPAWRYVGRRDGPVLDWLWVTLTRGEGDVDVDDITRPPAEAWALFRELPSGHDEDESPVEGPVLIKLNGSPQLDLTDGAKAFLKAHADGDGGDEYGALEPATIFTEYDSVHAMISLTATAAATSGTQASRGGMLANDIILGLGWQTRSWVMLGDSFPDWLPRVRLLFNAQSKFTISGSKVQDEANHIAVDRAFDWPEKALLGALGVDAYESDLAALGEYHARDTHVSAENKDVRTFLANVDKVLKKARNR